MSSAGASAVRVRPKQSLLRRLIWLAGYLAIGGYIALLLFAWLFSDRVLFQPHPASYRDSAAILKIATRTGAHISAVYVPNSNARYTLLYSHGNALDLGDLGPVLKSFQDAGFAVFAYDYEGYGTSEGAPTEEHCYADVDAAYDYLTKTLGVPPGQVISFGHSVGGGPATELAMRRHVAGLILESSFTSAFRVLTQVSVLPFDKFRNAEKLRLIHRPVLIISGKQDAVIPFAHGPRLFAAANEPKRSLWIDNAGHDDLFYMGGKRYWNALHEFADSLRP
jgi:abhydrolase domain-containing protein 17